MSAFQRLVALSSCLCAESLPPVSDDDLPLADDDLQIVARTALTTATTESILTLVGEIPAHTYIGTAEVLTG